MKWILINIFIIVQSITFIYASDIINIEKLNYTDQNFMKLYESTVKSKNRLLKKERLDEYPEPNFYRYTLKTGEDIWTIIAKTSLNIDTIATLNKIDFIGEINDGETVILPDLLGVFSGSLEELQERYPDFSKDVKSLDDPFTQLQVKLEKASLKTKSIPVKQSGINQSASNQVIAKTQTPGKKAEKNKIYFLPEVKLDFLEVAYIRGVVFHPPLSGVESSGFGLRKDPFINELTFHGGVDISAPEGAPVRTTRWGKVVYAGELGGYGNTVIIQHQLGYISLYGHLMEITVEIDQNVETGALIGRVGSTGKSTGPHLHFEIRKGNQKLNPENIPFFFQHK